MSPRRPIILLSFLAACASDIRVLPDGGGSRDATQAEDALREDARFREDAEPNQDLGADGGFQEDAIADAGFTPQPACEPEMLDCLDPGAEEVIEVPSEATVQEAFATATNGQVIQLRGQAIGSGFRVPGFVTLRGCANAAIRGSISFEGGAGTIEGFIVDQMGSIIANQTGLYNIRRNRFPLSTSQEPAIRASAIDGLVGASVAVIIDRNRFADRRLGITLATRYDTNNREIEAIITSNVFTGVDEPIRADESGLAGRIDVRIEQNTFHGFDDAIALYSVAPISTLIANVFVAGGRAVNGDSPYQSSYNLTRDVVLAPSPPPVAGNFSAGDPLFVDEANRDFRLYQPSPAVDVVPSAQISSSVDYSGCMRPQSISGEARGDIGAFEAQPQR